MKTANIKLVEIALEYTSGTDFERFFHAFYSALAGVDFVALGGTHDGGADAFLDQRLFEGRSGRAGTFYQATIQADHRAKVRQTVNRLREFGREPNTVHYFTSRTVPLIDKEEEELSAKLNVDIRIRDRRWIVGRINHSSQTVAAFESYLRPNIAFLCETGSATLIEGSPDISARTMCVFLGQEVDRRRGKTDLLEAVTDSLILWALEGTDPDKEEFMTRDQILAKIEGALPSARHFIRGVLDRRIELLSSKGNPSGREVRWYRKSDKYCLPFETREIIEEENAEDEFLKLKVLDIYAQRAAETLSSETELIPEKIATIAHRALELTFLAEGLELAEFLSGKRDENLYVTISDHVDNAINDIGLSGEKSLIAKSVTLDVLRQAFYNSAEVERVYYGKLSRTYTLLFTLRNEPRIVEYFKGMSSNFVLFVGTDIIIRALSERYLPTEDQMTINMLRILKEAGSTLFLTHIVVEEVQAHLSATDYEFRNWFLEIEPYVTRDIARHSDKILIRSYFYAKTDSELTERPRGWKSFIEQICSYNDLHKTQISRGQIKNYLVEKFGLEYSSIDDVKSLTNSDEVDQLAERIRTIKAEDVLARNDALQILAIYGKRHSLKEDYRPNPYGFRTWWLTHETRVRRCTGELVQSRGSQYIIRPEFVLNFVALSPSAEDVRNSYGTIFPTLLGVRLSNRMREEIFHDVMDRAKEVKELDDARAKTKMSDLSNRLKGDNFKQYEADLRSGRLDNR